MTANTNKKWSVLTLSTLAFTVNFAVWTLFSIIGIRIKEELGLNETEFGLLVATPILSGSLCRLPLGLITERFGGRLISFLHLLFVAIPTFGLAYGNAYWHYLVIGFFVGISGGAFAIGITYTSAWFESRQQGLAMGIFGAGNVGVALTNIIAPLIMVAYGWRTVPQVYALTLVAVAFLFWFFTQPDAVHQQRLRSKNFPPLNEQLKPLMQLRVWRFGLYYFFVFGGFVALALWLPRYFVDEYGLSLINASYLTLAFTLPGTLVRALGGWLSDQIGARQVNWMVFWICMVCLFVLSYPETSMTIHGIDKEISLNIGINVYVFTALIFVMGIAMGFGRASIYRLIHDYYPNNMGSVGGMVGLLGGLGGFALPIIFGAAVDITGVRSSCFMLLYGLLGMCMIWMYYAIKVDELLERIRLARDSDFLSK